MIQQMLFYTMFFSAVSTDLRPEGWECDLWPEGKLCAENGQFNRSLKWGLTQKQLLYMPCDPRWTEVQAIIEECDVLYKAWDTLYWAHMNASKYSITTRRDYLNKLRDYLGWENYYKYQMPPPVPVWRYREIEW